jgi:hypothetical protein
MNIFFLDHDLEKSALYHCDKHVVKMILEYAQILNAVMWRYQISAPYRVTHKNHPAVLWAGASIENWLFLRRLLCCLNDEFIYRFKGDNHKSYLVAQALDQNAFANQLHYFSSLNDNSIVIEVKMTQVFLEKQHSQDNTEINKQNTSQLQPEKILSLSEIKSLIVELKSFLNTEFSLPPQMMPDIYKNTDVVKAYRDYYMGAKHEIAFWKKRDIPFWFA